MRRTIDVVIFLSALLTVMLIATTPPPTDRPHLELPQVWCCFVVDTFYQTPRRRYSWEGFKESWPSEMTPQPTPEGGYDP